MTPLSELTIVERYADGAPLALRLAGALTGRIAADLGARVVKIETRRDPVRDIPPFVGATSTTFAFLNAGKTIADDRRRATMHADIAIVDAATARTATDLPGVRAVLSMFRNDDTRPASEFTVMALGGLLDMVGDPERQPLKLGGHQAAYAAGLAAYTGIAAASCRRTPSGKIVSETVRVNMLDTVIWLNWKGVPASAAAPSLTRTGAAAEWQVVRCADGFVALVYQEPDWPTLCDMVGDARLRADELRDRSERIRRSSEIVRIVEEAFVGLTRREIHALALARRIPLGPIWDPRELHSDPHNVARNFFGSIAFAGQRAAMPRLPVIWSGKTFAVGAVPGQARSPEGALA